MEVSFMKKQFTKPDQATLKNRLTKLQYEVTQNQATEPPFANEYNDNFEEGIYVDIVTGEPLFSSRDKFESHCGWPSFSKPLAIGNVALKDDYTHHMHRTEVKSAIGTSHLGHVFNDGPVEAGGLRYCINSASLKFIKKDDLTQAGYGEYLKLFEKE